MKPATQLLSILFATTSIACSQTSSTGPSKTIPSTEERSELYSLKSDEGQTLQTLYVHYIFENRNPDQEVTVDFKRITDSGCETAQMRFRIHPGVMDEARRRDKTLQVTDQGAIGWRDMSPVVMTLVPSEWEPTKDCSIRGKVKKASATHEELVAKADNANRWTPHANDLQTWKEFPERLQLRSNHLLASFGFGSPIYSMKEKAFVGIGIQHDDIVPLSQGGLTSDPDLSPLYEEGMSASSVIAHPDDLALLEDIRIIEQRLNDWVDWKGDYLRKIAAEAGHTTKADVDHANAVGRSALNSILKELGYLQ